MTDDSRPGFPGDLARYADQVLEAKARSCGEWADFRCRAHDDRSASCSVKFESGWVHCQAGTCGWTGWIDQYAQQFGLPTPPDKREAPSVNPTPKPKRTLKKRPDNPTNLIGSWVYRDTVGSPVFVVDKIADGDGKRFLQAHYSAGDWYYGTTTADGERIEPLLYRLDHLAKLEPTTVFVFEGEKDVDQGLAWGLEATTTMMGAGQGKAERTKGWEHLHGHHVVIVPDDDSATTNKDGKPKKEHEVDAGLKHAQAIAALLEDQAKSIKIVRLPGVSPHGGDFSDYVAAGHTKDAFLKLVQATPDLKPRKKPVVVTSKRDPEEVDLEIAELLTASCGYFAREREIVEIYEAARGEAVALKAVTNREMLSIIQETCQLVEEKWIAKTETTVQTPHRPTHVTVEAAFRNLARTLPQLTRVAQMPFFSRDGNLVSKHGYDEGTGTFLASKTSYNVPENPTAEQIEKALSLLRDDLLGEFWWADETSKTHAICACLQPFLADYIGDCSPAYLSAANRPGCGKTYLAQIISRITMPNGAKEVAESKGRDSAELEKRINGVILQGDQVLIIDNVKSQLDEVWLLGYLSQNTMPVRALGSSVIHNTPNTHLWFITANTPKLGKEITRRTVPVNQYVSPEIEDTSKRNFKRNLKEWVRFNRKGLIEACLTLIQGWMKAGATQSAHRLDSFESWAKRMGGLCEFLGLPGFLATQETHLQEVDESAQERRDIIETLVSARGRIRFQDAAFFFDAMEALDCLPDRIDQRMPEKKQIQQVGRWLSSVAKFTPKVGAYRVSMSKCSHRKVNLYTIGERDSLTTCSTENPAGTTMRDNAATCPAIQQGVEASTNSNEGSSIPAGTNAVCGDKKTVVPQVVPAGKNPVNTRGSEDLAGTAGQKCMHASHVRAHVHAHEGQCAKVVPQPRKPDSGGPKIEHPSPTPGDIAKRVKQLDAMIAVQRMCGNRAQVEKLTRQREALLSPGSDPPTPKPNGPPPRSNGAGRAQPPPDAGKTDREIMNELNDGLGDLL